MFHSQRSTLETLLPRGPMNRLPDNLGLAANFSQARQSSQVPEQVSLPSFNELVNSMSLPEKFVSPEFPHFNFYTSSAPYPELLVSGSLPIPHIASPVYGNSPVSNVMHARLFTSPVPTAPPINQVFASGKMPVPPNHLTAPTAQIPVPPSAQVPVTGPTQITSSPEELSLVLVSENMKIAPASRKKQPLAAANDKKTAEGKGKHVCKICLRLFTTSGHLARHNRIHTGERDHVCPWPTCVARFARHDNCIQHYKTHTNGKSRLSSKAAK